MSYHTQQKEHQGAKWRTMWAHLPNPAISADVRVTLPICCKTRALTASTLALCTVTPAEPVLAHFGTPIKKNWHEI